MTRYLAHALGAQQPLFGQSLQALEQASGHPSADIRISSEIIAKVRAKVIALGLDPNDTTAPELYGALQARLRQDEHRVRLLLGIAEDAAAGEVLRRVQQRLMRAETAKTCFALKGSAARRLLKAKPPKAAMKQLGYRSLDSMLKHESLGALYAAALMYESPSWHKAFRTQYSTLQSGDFEQREIAIEMPKAKRWSEVAEQYAQTSRNAIMCFKELGSIVLLPVSARIEGLALTSMLLSLHYMNDIRAYSSFAKLHQVKPAFGGIIGQSATSEPMTTALIAGQPVPWKVIQRYYGKTHKDGGHPAVFEPHVQPDDLMWQDPEAVLAELEPVLDFWSDTQYTVMLDKGEPVSLNILDVALGYCNQLSFADRIVHYVREHLWHELMGRYLHQENLESAVHQQLSQDLVDGEFDLALGQASS